MKLIATLFLFVLGLSMHAQEVAKDGKNYEVKKDKIFLNGEDVTNTISDEDKTIIFAEAQKIRKAEKLAKAKEKEEKKKEKAVKKAEKAQKKAEKEAKKAERELKKQEKAQQNFNKATSDLNKAQKKYQKLKSKGKLSPVAEQKWLEKIEKLNKKLEKAKSRI